MDQEVNCSYVFENGIRDGDGFSPTFSREKKHYKCVITEFVHIPLVTTWCVTTECCVFFIIIHVCTNRYTVIIPRNCIVECIHGFHKHFHLRGRFT